jgi:hypothetical protein
MHEVLERRGRVLLGFVLETGSPDSITETLGIEPDSAIYHGGRHVSRCPDGSIHEYEMSSTGLPVTWFSWGGWNETGSVQDQLEHWCERLNGKKDALSSIQAAGVYGSLHCHCEVLEKEKSTPLLSKLGFLGQAFLCR